MNPFFFGDSDRQLFGVHSPPQESGARPPGVLLCYPYGQETVRVHRIYRALADQLSRSGCHVMRFDYYGTGDSAGDCNQGTLEQWQADIVTAHEELRDMAGVTRVVWIGLRLGGTLAALAARRAPPGLAGVVLWDPIVKGADYLEEMSRAHWLYIAEGLDEPVDVVLGRRGPQNGRFREALGYECGEQLYSEFRQLDLLALDRKPSRKAMVLAGAAPPTPPELQEVLKRLGSEVTWLESPAEDSWNSDEAMNAFIVPRETLASLVSAVERWR